MGPGGFRWNEWNLEHATKHGCTVAEIESVVRQNWNKSQKHGGEKRIIQGRGQGDRMIQVIYFFDEDDEDTIYLIQPCLSRCGDGGASGEPE